MTSRLPRTRRLPAECPDRHAAGRATRGERIGVVGPNGAGKTTLLRTVAGELPALEGYVRAGHNVTPGYLAQMRGRAIPGATVLDAMLAGGRVETGRRAHTWPASCSAARTCSSPWRSSRVASGRASSSAVLGITPANLLLLDEPTNHLDIPAREALEAFLREHAGRRSSSCPTTGGCSNRCASACGWSSRARPERSAR